MAAITIRQRQGATDRLNLRSMASVLNPTKPRADVGGQESQLAALHEFERLAEQKKTARE
jgi:hypothetical protein